MKTKLQIIWIALIGLLITSCSSSMYMSKSSVTSTDDIYYTPTKTTSTLADSDKGTTLETKNQDPSKLDFAALEKKYSKILASNDTSKIDTLIYKAESDNPYERILSDSYQESYERRLRGQLDPRYGLSNLDTYFSDDYFYANAYDPAFYNIVVMGSQVWVEPWYISNLFGHRNNFSYSFGFGFGIWGINPWYSNYYYNPYYGINTWYSSWNPYYGYIDPSINFHNWHKNNIENNDYFGRRPDNTTNLTTLNRRTGTYENEIISSRRKGGISNESGFNRTENNIRTRNTNQIDLTSRSGQRNNQEIIRRGNRNENLSTTRLRGETTSRNINMTEPIRRNNNNSYQRPRSTNNDGYIRTGTRNQNLNNGSVSRDNTTRNTSTVRENRNSSPTYNRPNRVDSSTERGRTTNYSGGNNRESNYRDSGRSSGSSSATRTNSGTSSSSTSSSNSQQSSSSGSNDRRR